MSSSPSSSSDSDATERPSTPRPRPLRTPPRPSAHRRHRRNLSDLTAPAGWSGSPPEPDSGPVTALRRSPTVRNFDQEDEGLRQLDYAEPVNPRHLGRLLKAHLDLQEHIDHRPDAEEGDDDALMMASPNAFPSLDTSLPGGSRVSSSPTTPQGGAAGSMNGNGVGASASYMAPLPVGHQQDLNYLYTQIQELSAILRSNREKVNVITRAAEEVARRANGALTDGDGSSESDKARIRELELELAKSKHVIELYKHEQKENTNLIAMYEEAMGTATEQIRNYCGDIEARFLRQRRHYNDLLQQEKDDHLQSRLDRDHWYAQTLKVCEMLRTAFRLRTDEWCEEYTVVAGLQTEVRCLRRCLGMEAEKPEDETGWPYLKDLPLNDQA